MGQMASLLNKRQHVNLPSTSEVNLVREGIKHCKAITLRSGRKLEGPRKAKEDDMEAGQSSRSEITQKPAEKGTESKSKVLSYNPLLDLTEIPFPQSLWRPQGKKPSQNEERKKEDNKEIQMESHFVQVPTPGIPYPQKLKKVKLEKQFVKFLDIFKKLHINIPFMDALENMPSYMKFMKKDLGK